MEFQSNFSVPNVLTKSQAKGNTRDWNDKRWNHRKPGASTRTGYDDFENNQFISVEEPCNNSLWKVSFPKWNNYFLANLAFRKNTSSIDSSNFGVILNTSLRWSGSSIAQHHLMSPSPHRHRGWIWNDSLKVQLFDQSYPINNIMKVNLKCDVKQAEFVSFFFQRQKSVHKPQSTIAVLMVERFLPQKAYESIEFTTFQIPLSPVDPEEHP